MPVEPGERESSEETEIAVEIVGGTAEAEVAEEAVVVEVAAVITVEVAVVAEVVAEVVALVVAVVVAAASSGLCESSSSAISCDSLKLGRFPPTLLSPSL